MCDTLLTALDFKPEDKIIIIRENKVADATFILSSFMFKCISEDKNICLINLHNTFNHYQNIGRRLGFDLSQKLRENQLKTIDIIGDETNKYFLVSPEIIAENLLHEICTKTDELLQNNKHSCIIIDDLSHLLDLGCDVKLVMNLMQHLISFTLSKNISIVVNCHAVSNADDILVNFLFYSANLQISVSALKTGRSKNVSGILNVTRSCEYSLRKPCMYHYKLLDKEIRVFAPGRAII